MKQKTTFWQGQERYSTAQAAWDLTYKRKCSSFSNLVPLPDLPVPNDVPFSNLPGMIFCERKKKKTLCWNIKLNSGQQLFQNNFYNELLLQQNHVNYVNFLGAAWHHLSCGVECLWKVKSEVKFWIIQQNQNYEFHESKTHLCGDDAITAEISVSWSKFEHLKYRRESVIRQHQSDHGLQESKSLRFLGKLKISISYSLLLPVLRNFLPEPHGSNQRSLGQRA